MPSTAQNQRQTHHKDFESPANSPPYPSTPFSVPPVARIQVFLRSKPNNTAYHSSHHLPLQLPATKRRVLRLGERLSSVIGPLPGRIKDSHIGDGALGQ